MVNRTIRRIAVATIVGMASPAFLMTSVRAQNQQSPLPIPVGHFLLVLPQGQVPYRIALGLPVATDSRSGPRMAVPRVVTLIGPASDASEITRDWLESIAFPSESQTLLLLQVNSQGVLVRQVRTPKRGPDSLVDCCRAQREAGHRNAGPVLRSLSRPTSVLR